MSPTLPHHPNLDHLKKQAKKLLKSFRSGDLQVSRAFQEYLPHPFPHFDDFTYSTAIPPEEGATRR